MTDEVWAPCAYFEENYEVSDQGRVRHAVSKLIKTSFVNNFGVPYVTLWDRTRRRNVNKPVATLLAETFIPRNNYDFDTVIYLNGNRENLSIANLAWRPRAFAINYHRQISLREAKDFHDRQFECLETGTVHHSTYQVAMAEGVLPSGVFSSIVHNDRYYDEANPWTKQSVFPTGKSYRSIGRYSFLDLAGIRNLPAQY